MIYVVKHKECETPKMPGYKDLGVGKMFNGKGDNINHLNPYLNEVTALYDIWKNKPDDIVGMCHYRRFFVDKGKFLTFSKATTFLKNAEIITMIDHAPLKLDEFLAQAISKPIFDKYVTQMPKGFQTWLKEANGFNPCNMFICKHEVIDEYCETLFPIILPMVEQFIREDANGDYWHDRALGFICELFFAYWCKDKDRCKLTFIII